MPRKSPYNSASCWVSDGDFVGCRGVDSLRGMAQTIVGEYDYDALAIIFGGYDAIPGFGADGTRSAAEDEKLATLVEMELEKHDVVAFLVPTRSIYSERWDTAMVVSTKDLAARPGRGRIKVLGFNP